MKTPDKKSVACQCNKCHSIVLLEAPKNQSELNQGFDPCLFCGDNGDWVTVSYNPNV